jgi:hypothetical protein
LSAAQKINGSSSPFARLIVAGFHLDLTPTGLHAAPGVGEGVRAALSMARISLFPGAEVAIRSSEPGGILPPNTRSFSTYLFFINTKTRQPVGFQSTDIVD